MRFCESGLKVVADVGSVRKYFYAWMETMCKAIDEKVNKLFVKRWQGHLP